MHSEKIPGPDHLDRLPDELLHAIFARIRDARTLVGLLSLCRRFRSLVPLSDSVSLSFTRPQPVVQLHKSRPSFSKNPLGFLLDRIVRNPIRRLVSGKFRGGRASYYDEVGIVGDITERLRVFDKARDVRVILPCEGRLPEKDGTFLRWRASYGSRIRSSIILGASEVRIIEEELLQEKVAPIGEGLEETSAPTLLSDSELKLRVVWIISCLIAASYRHYMTRKVIVGCPGIRTMVVGDERRQGRVVMGEDEVSETRREGDECMVQDNNENTLERSKAPELRMKMWHAPSLELPQCRRVLKGATLVVIYPAPAAGDASGSTQDCYEDSILQRGIEDEEEEDEVFVEAVKELRKRKKSYLMEMNPF